MTSVDEKEHVFEEGKYGKGLHSSKCWCGGPDGSPFDPKPAYKVGDEVYVRYRVMYRDYETYNDKCELVYYLSNVYDLEVHGEGDGNGFSEEHIEKKARKLKR